MRSLIVIMCGCFFADCSANVIEHKNGIVKVDKWGSSKTNMLKKQRKPSINEIRPTWTR